MTVCEYFLFSAPLLLLRFLRLLRFLGLLRLGRASFASGGGGPNKNTPRPPPRESEKLGGGLDPPPRESEKLGGGQSQKS